MAENENSTYGLYGRTKSNWDDDLKTNGMTLTGLGKETINSEPSAYNPGEGMHRLIKGIQLQDSKSKAGFTPFIGGRNLFVVTKMPRFMEIVSPETTALFRHLTQFYTKGLTGFQDLQLGVTTVDSGIEATGMDVATSISGATKDITLEYMPDVRGLFIVKYIETWMSGIIDPLSNVGTYLGAFDLDSKLRWDEANHTMEGIQIITDVSRRVIEAQALIVGMKPKNAPRSYLDSTQGQNEYVIPQIQYSATVYPNLADIYDVLAEIDILGYIKTARYNTISMAHVLDARKDALAKEASRNLNSFDTTGGYKKTS